MMSMGAMDMGVSSPKKDTRTSVEVLEQIQKEVPINTFWKLKNTTDYPLSNSLKHETILYWVYGYEASRDSNTIRLKSKIISYSNKSWHMRDDASFTHDLCIQTTKDEFEKAEKKLIKGFKYVDVIRDTNKINSHWDFPCKQLSEIEPGDKFIYFLNNGTVIRFGERKEFFIQSNGKFDEGYNCIMRQMSCTKMGEDYFTLIADMSNWNLNDKSDYYIIDDEYYNMMNELFDDMRFYYDVHMMCDTNEEYKNFKRKYKLQKIMTD